MPSPATALVAAVVHGDREPVPYRMQMGVRQARFRGDLPATPAVVADVLETVGMEPRNVGEVRTTTASLIAFGAGLVTETHRLRRQATMPTGETQRPR